MNAAELLAEGLALQTRGDLSRAESLYRRVLAAEPANADALHYLGVLTLQSGRSDEAVQLLEQATAIGGATPERLGGLGVAYLVARRPGDAVQTLTQAIGIEPASPGHYYNRALALYDQGLLDRAAADYRQCLALAQGNHPAALNNLGDLERELGDLDAALAHLDAAIALAPHDGSAHYNRSLVLLSMGRLAEGFAEYEWRLRMPAHRLRAFAAPAWDGSPLAEGTLLVHTEQGLGDAIQFVRYLPLAARRVRRLICELPAPVLPLVASLPNVELLPAGAPLAGFDAQVSLASLPFVFRTTLGTVPAAIPYLAVEPDRVARWRRELARYDGVKVGLVWQGNPTFREDRYRSFPLAALRPVAEVPGVRLFSLQKGAGREQLAQAAPLEIVDLGGRSDNDPNTFADTAAIMENLDLVISSDTSSAHLAGALGVTLWLATSWSPSWRWLQHRADSPWYPSARLFRQPSFGDWPGVFQAMAAELAGRLQAQ